MNRNKLFFLLLCSVFAISISGQRTVSDYLNVAELEGQDIMVLDGLNSEEIEFAPHPFRDGLLFVNGNTDKKRIKKKDKIHFQMMYANEKNGLYTPVVFDSISSPDIFDGPVCYIPGDNVLIITKNQNEFHEIDERQEMKLGIFFYRLENGIWKYDGSFSHNHNEFNVCHPAWDSKNNRLYFASDIPGGFGNLDLYYVEQKPGGNWTIPVNLGPAINSRENDCFPFIFENAFLFYSSDRENISFGFDVFASVFQDEQWLNNIKLPGEVNSNQDDLGLVLSPDGTKLYFASSRPGGKGKDDIFSIVLENSIVRQHPDFHTIRIVNTDSNDPVKDASIRFYKFQTSSAVVEKKDDSFSSINLSIDPKTVKGSKPVFTNEAGEVFISLKEGDYIVQSEKAEFHSYQHLITIDKMGRFFEFKLDSILCKEINLIITDSKTTAKVKDAEISDGATIKEISDDDGRVSLCIYRESPQNLTISKNEFQDFGLTLEYQEVNHGEEIVVSLRPKKIFTKELPVYSGEYTILENILYDFDQSELNAQAKLELDSLALHLLKYTSISIELSAHTDSRGGEMYNQVLSERRVEKAKSYLIEKGVSGGRIAAIGYGESRLRNHCMDGVDCAESAHAINRRTEVKVVAIQE